MIKGQRISIHKIILPIALMITVGLLLFAQTRNNFTQAASPTREGADLLSKAPQQSGNEGEPEQPASTADHSKFEVLQQKFETGPDVTAACLTCHTEAAKQIHKTIHWTWECDCPDNADRKLGKKHVINNFCISAQSNEPRCTSCHVGYGWKDKTFDFTSEENVDCLVCHDTTGTYKKFPPGAGHPVYETKEYPPGSGKIWEPPDLANVAQHVGATSRSTCGACHFYGGGGAGIKHGTLDPSLVSPDKSVDVHMDVDGPNFTCATCHTGPNHQIVGSRLRMTVADETGPALFFDETHHASCESCHELAPHKNPKLNDHTDRVACQTCHVPILARGGRPTKASWDWSQAGRLTEDGKAFEEEDEKGRVVYYSKKGAFSWMEGDSPEYVWFNGIINYTLPTDKIDDTKVVQINRMQGSFDDPKSLIYPVKVHRGKQPYDAENKTLVMPHLFGKDDTAYWGNYDWDKAIRAGMDYAGLPYSGKYGFVETEMYWPATHMVAPSEEALSCDSCHSRDGRLAKLTGFYMPGRDRNLILDALGWLVVVGSLLMVIGHGALRYVSSKKGDN